MFHSSACALPNGYNLRKILFLRIVYRGARCVEGSLMPSAAWYPQEQSGELRLSEERTVNAQRTITLKCAPGCFQMLSSKLFFFFS